MERLSMKIRKSQINSFLGLIVVLFSILFSKTVYFGIINRTTYQYVYYGIVIAMAVFCGLEMKKLKMGIIISFPLIFLMIINIVINKNDMTSSNVNLVIGNCLYVASAMLIAVCLNKRQFVSWYIRIMEIMCIVSLPCWLITIINPDLALSFCQTGYNWRVRYGYSPFYTWGWNGIIFQRNSGMFWESGAFQRFILLALLMLLFNADNGEVKNRRIMLILLAGTLITTQATTGYILLMILVLGCWTRIRNLIGTHNRNLRKVLTVLLGIGVCYIIISSDNISTKFSTDNISFGIRFFDIFGGIAMCVKGELFELGETTIRDAARIVLGINSDDSAVLLAMTDTYGLLFGVYYIGLMCRGITKFFGNINAIECIVLVMTFLVLHMTEGLWCLPIYLIIPLMGIISRGGVPLSRLIHWLKEDKLVHLPLALVQGANV